METINGKRVYRTADFAKLSASGRLGFVAHTSEYPDQLYDYNENDNAQELARFKQFKTLVYVLEDDSAGDKDWTIDYYEGLGHSEFRVWGNGTAYTTLPSGNLTYSGTVVQKALANTLDSGPFHEGTFTLAANFANRTGTITLSLPAIKVTSSSPSPEVNPQNFRLTIGNDATFTGNGSIKYTDDGGTERIITAIQVYGEFYQNETAHGVMGIYSGQTGPTDPRDISEPIGVLVGTRN